MFTWQPIYREIADKLPPFESKNSELVQLMTKLHQRGLKKPGDSPRVFSTGRF